MACNSASEIPLQSPQQIRRNYSSMACKIITFLLFLPSKLRCSNTQSWIKAGYWDSRSQLPVANINSALFTHLICGFAYLNPSTYTLYINSSDEQSFSTFTNTVRGRNPSVTTLLSIWVGEKETYVFSSMMNQSSYRESFIESSIRMARDYGFQGLDLYMVFPTSHADMNNLGPFLDKWRVAIASEARNSSKSQLLLVMTVTHSPVLESVSYPIDAIRRNLDWVHLAAYAYHVPTKENFTGLHAPLYNPLGGLNTDHGVTEWINRGISASKMVLGLPYHGYLWRLVNPKDNAIGAEASGPAITLDGLMGYKFIKSFIQDYGYGVTLGYNNTFVVTLCTVGWTWINFDGVEAIEAKIAYAKAKGLLGYNVFHVGNDDDNWELSRAAYETEKDQGNKLRLLIGIPLPTALVIILLGSIMFYLHRRVVKSKGKTDMMKISPSKLKIKMSVDEGLNSNGPNPQMFSYGKIKAATKNFSSENKLGEGGFGPVYMGKLPKGQEIAVKRLSKSSTQGMEEFQNEVTLTAKLQHVNLVTVLGFCIEGEEKMLIYEYMPNRSLDFYLYDPLRKYMLDWSKRVQVIEGLTQGLLYLQEYSNFTIIHRDLKASNILLDSEMNPKISDFGIARLFRKDEFEANTSRIVGTYGYVPPEYVREGIYSMKYDVYSFGVLLLQIISGKRNACYYGSDENLNLLEYAYELWKNGEGAEFIDSSLDDSSSPCKLVRCMQVALLCVQVKPVDRPSMLEVSAMLKNEIAAMATPKRPAFSIKTDEDGENKYILPIEICSVNGVTISQMVPR